MDLTRGPNGAPAPAPALEGAHRVGDVVAARTYRPGTRDEVVEAVREAVREKLPLVPWGAGVALTRERAPAGPFAVLDLSALRRIVRWEPDDFTLTAETGVTIESLRATLAARGQELPLEAAEAWGATLGGVVAANASGPRRMALGAPRDRILGARFVTGDGVLARTGGMVVKNVAGHAAHRLLCGSRGALAAIVEVSLKLSPQPPSRAAMVWGADAATLADAARWAGIARRECAVLTLLGRAVAAKHPVLASDAPFALIAGFEADAPWVDAQVAWMRERLGAPRLVVRDASVATLWQQLADFEELPGARLGLSTATRSPAALAALAGSAHAERLVFHAAAGRLHVWPTEGAAAELERTLAPAGFVVIERRGTSSEGAESTGPLRALRHRVRAAFDPAGAFAFGDLWERGGI